MLTDLDLSRRNAQSMCCTIGIARTSSLRSLLASLEQPASACLTPAIPSAVGDSISVSRCFSLPLPLSLPLSPEAARWRIALVARVFYLSLSVALCLSLSLTVSLCLSLACSSSRSLALWLYLSLSQLLPVDEISLLYCFPLPTPSLCRNIFEQRPRVIITIFIYPYDWRSSQPKQT